MHDTSFGHDRTWIGEIRKLAQSEANKSQVYLYSSNGKHENTMAVRMAAGQYNGFKGIKNVVPARNRGTRHMSQYTIIRGFPGQPGQPEMQGRLHLHALNR